MWLVPKVPSESGSLASPLTDLMTTERRFSLTPETLKVFEELKCNLSEAPVLCSPCFSKPFAIHCDAGKSGVSDVLIQVSQEGEERPIAFISKKLNRAQKPFTVTEQDCVSVI